MGHKADRNNAAPHPRALYTVSEIALLVHVVSLLSDNPLRADHSS